MKLAESRASTLALFALNKCGRNDKKHRNV